MPIGHTTKETKALFRFSFFITHHSSLKIPYPFGTITHLSSLNIFHTVCGPQTCHSMQFFFFFFNPQYPNSPNSVKKKEKKKERKNPVSERRNPMKKNGSKGAADLTSGSLHVCLIRKIPLKTELWKLKTAKMCFQFP